MQSRRKQLQKCLPGKFCHSCTSRHDKARCVVGCLVALARSLDREDVWKS